MALKEEFYISISPSDYRTTKSTILMSQVDLLETLKRLHKLKVLTRQKQDLKIKLQKLFSSALASMSLIQNKMPEQEFPKIIYSRQKKEVKPQAVPLVRKNIEDELRMIQTKLRELNT